MATVVTVEVSAGTFLPCELSEEGATCELSVVAVPELLSLQDAVISDIMDSRETKDFEANECFFIKNFFVSQKFKTHGAQKPYPLNFNLSKLSMSKALPEMGKYVAGFPGIPF